MKINIQCSEEKKYSIFRRKEIFNILRENIFQGVRDREERRVYISCVWSSCGHIGGHNLISRCGIGECIYIPVIHTRTVVPVSTCIYIPMIHELWYLQPVAVAVEEVPMISSPPSPHLPANPTVQCKMCAKTHAVDRAQRGSRLNLIN